MKEYCLGAKQDIGMMAAQGFHGCGLARTTYIKEGSKLFVRVTTYYYDVQNTYSSEC
jgi:hypothetical protein